MLQVQKTKSSNPSSISFGRLLRELQKPVPSFELSVVIRHAMEIHQSPSPLQLMASFADNLRSKFFVKIKKHNFNGLKEIINELNWEVIGEPKKEQSTTKERVFLGCQVSSKSGKKIYISSNQSSASARVVMAHELMHSLFATVNNKRPGNLPSDYIEELLCDYGAARMLIDETDLTNELKTEIKANAAVTLLHLSNYLNIPRKYLAYRIFDLNKNNNLGRISAIIEWQLKNEINEHVLIPTWSVCEDAYIPATKFNQSTAKKSGVIYKTFMNTVSNQTHEEESKSLLFATDKSDEHVSIGSLLGNYSIHTCSFGKIDNKNRFALSVFIPK